MISKIEAHKDCQSMRRDYKVFLIVAETNGMTFKFNGHTNPLHDLQYAKRDFYRYYQTGQTTNIQYPETQKIRSWS